MLVIEGSCEVSKVSKLLRMSTWEIEYKHVCRGKKIALEIARGLAWLHSHDVIHLDIKSPNVLLKADGAAKLGDVVRSLPSSRAVRSTFMFMFMQLPPRWCLCHCLLVVALSWSSIKIKIMSCS